MGNKKILGFFGNVPIDAKEEQAGFTPSVSIANAAIVDTSISDFSGLMILEDVDNGHSAIAQVHKNANAVVISSVTGSAEINDTKDNASTINIYVEGGTIQVQNLSGSAVNVRARVL